MFDCKYDMSVQLMTSMCVFDLGGFAFIHSALAPEENFVWFHCYVNENTRDLMSFIVVSLPA